MKALLLAGLLAATAAIAQPDPTAVLQARAEAAGAPQAIALVLERDGRQRVLTVGETDVGTRFEWGSVTKAMTGSLLARLAAQGRVDADEPLVLAFPALQGRPAGAVTLRALATHRSGWPRLPDDAAMAWSAIRRPSDPYAGYGQAELDAWLQAWPGAKGGPGEPGFAYSNLGFAVLGQALAARAGQPYAELLAQEILRPGGAPGATLADDAIGGHDGSGLPTPSWTLGPFQAAGALRADAAQMAALVAAARDGRPPFGAGAEAPQAGRGDEGRQVGLGWLLTERHGDRITWHNGGTGGHRSFVGFSRETGRVVVLAANGRAELDDLGLHLLNPAFALEPTAERSMGLAGWMPLLLLGPGLFVLGRWAQRPETAPSRAQVAVSGLTLLALLAFAARIADWRPWGGTVGLAVAAALALGAWGVATWRSRGQPAWSPGRKLIGPGLGLGFALVLAAWTWGL